MFKDWDTLECPTGGGFGKWKAFSECVDKGMEDCDGDVVCQKQVEGICEELECGNIDF